MTESPLIGQLAVNNGVWSRVADCAAFVMAGCVRLGGGVGVPGEGLGRLSNDEERYWGLDLMVLSGGY